MLKIKLYKRSKLSLLIAILLLSTIPGLSNAQVTIPPFVSNNAGTLVYENTNGVTTDLISAYNILDMEWSQDGQYIGFIRFERNVLNVPLLVAGIANIGQHPIETQLLQTQTLTWGYGISWLSDGRLIYVLDSPTADPQDSYRKLDIFATRFNQNPELLGTVAVQDGCGGGNALPPDWRYHLELGGSGNVLTLIETPHGILYSSICTGTELALLNLETGISTPFATNLTKAVVSQDGNYVAGIQLDSWTQPIQTELAVYDIATGDFEIIPTAETPDLVFWNQDGTGLYYTTRVLAGDLMNLLTDSERVQLTSSIGFELDYVNTFQSEVYYVSLITNETTVVYSADVYAIARVFEVEDAIYISRVPNSDNWLEQLIAGTINYGFETDEIEAIQTEVYRIERRGTIFGEESFLGWYEQFTPFIAPIITITRIE